MRILKQIIHKALNQAGYDLHRVSPPALASPPPAPPAIPDGAFYRPLFSPWRGLGDFARYLEVARARTLVSPDRCWVLYSLLRQALRLEGEIWECGVYRGGTAAMMARVIADEQPGRLLRLFDTFTGMPDTDPAVDLHGKGDFADTSLESVRDFVGGGPSVSYHPGFLPGTFKGLESSVVAFAHVDVDIYKSVWDCCEFILPRLRPGGFMVFDDYGFPSCPGARASVDAFFARTDLVPLVLPTGQAVVFNSPRRTDGPA